MGDGETQELEAFRDQLVERSTRDSNPGASR
jgi:hypothetical protein